MNSIYYQGHASLRLTTDQGHVVYIDPYAGDGYDQKADLILISHQHYDHNQIDLPAKKDDCIIWQNFDLLKDGIYQIKTFHEISVEGVPAYNNNHAKNECVGFIIAFNSLTIYIAGDTSTTDMMKSFKALHFDYAFLPCDGIYNMDITEAIQCANVIQAKRVIPYHTSPKSLFDLNRAKKFTADNTVILRPGETLNLDDAMII